MPLFLEYLRLDACSRAASILSAQDGAKFRFEFESRWHWWSVWGQISPNDPVDHLGALQVGHVRNLKLLPRRRCVTATRMSPRASSKIVFLAAVVSLKMRLGCFCFVFDLIRKPHRPALPLLPTNMSQTGSSLPAILS